MLRAGTDSGLGLRVTGLLFRNLNTAIIKLVFGK